MDIKVYGEIYNGLKAYNERNGAPYGNTVLDEEPINATYPITIIDEIRNTANTNFNGCFERVSTIGYKITIYAQDKGDFSKKQIARELAEFVDRFMTNYVGLSRVGFAPQALVRDNSLHGVVLTYSGSLHENRRIIY